VRGGSFRQFGGFPEDVVDKLFYNLCDTKQEGGNASTNLVGPGNYDEPSIYWTIIFCSNGSPHLPIGLGCCNAQKFIRPHVDEARGRKALFSLHIIGTGLSSSPRLLWTINTPRCPRLSPCGYTCLLNLILFVKQNKPAFNSNGRVHFCDVEGLFKSIQGVRLTTPDETKFSGSVLKIF
jgi:hypothetical protein